MSHCLLAQSIVAEGRATDEAAVVKPVVQFCLDNDVNIFQMPCPEVLCPAGGLGRPQHGKTWYEQKGLREISAQIAKQQVEYMSQLIGRRLQILAIVGVEFSPACAPNYLNKGRAVVKGKGIYVEELERELRSRGLQVPFIGMNRRWPKKLKRQLNASLVALK